MKVEGGCYCGALRYESTGAPVFKIQCHCRECQYYTGGHANVAVILPASEFKYTKGTPRSFKRSDLEHPATREFCENCGSAILSRSGRERLAGTVILKVGSLDDPKAFGNPQAAIFTLDKQPFHHIPDGMPSFERLPPG